MSSWKEFERLHQQALEEQGIRTQLNSATHGSSSERDGAGPQGGGDELVVGDGTLVGGARLINDSLLGDTKKAGSTADVQSSVTVQYLADWETAIGLGAAIVSWKKKVEDLAIRLIWEAESLELANENFTFTNDDITLQLRVRERLLNGDAG
ncbi:hypothetical protein ACWD33_14705 [Streptomyces xiamenensis]|uniref:hypothetical protein n=1 Tax=Streptomyces xiamenensis TaxID=408015 RepID=UPI0011D21E29|nr:hypothetical protein [Streptomyces xiamenensis]